MMKLNHPYVGSEHLLLAILSYKNAVSTKLYKYDITYERFRDEVVDVIGKGSISSKWFLFTPLLKRVIQNAIFDSKENNEKVVSIERIFSSLLSEGEGVAIRLLIGMNIDIDLIYRNFSSQLFIQKTRKNKKLLITDFSVDFNKKVKNNEIDPVVGRDNEVNRVIEILCRRTKNNPLLIGEAGVGKTAIVEELSRRIVEGNVPKKLHGKVILSISVASLISGTKYRGEFEERINKIIQEVEENDEIILFIDEVHTIVGAGGAEGAIDASNILKPSLARGKIKIIGATTNDEYMKYIEKDKALDRRFQKIYINEPCDEDTVKMLLSLKGLYESFHHVIISDEIIKYIIYLSGIYIKNRKNPDKSIDILDEVCAKASINGYNEYNYYKNNIKLKKIISDKNNAIKNQDFTEATKLKNIQNRLETKINNEIYSFNKFNNPIIIDKHMVNKVVEDKTKIPIYSINTQNKKILSNLNRELKNRIIGQNHILKDVMWLTRMILFGFRKNKPYSFLFLGPTGVGKTLLVKTYAELLFGKDSFIRIDMSEFKEESSISKLLGSAPGYVGYDDNNLVFDKVRNHPHSVILLDEIEKASKSVVRLFLQILDEGFIHDSLGREIDFNNSIIFMTSNLGMTSNSLGFNSSDSYKQNLRDFFSVEFLNRVDKICVFNSINDRDIRKIIRSELEIIKSKYRDINISFSDKKISELVEKTNYLEYGARRVKKVIEEEIENQLINCIIEGKTLVIM
ncbi:MAG: ATP-dependent Clp protease ATP-binding subunit [Bacilli bacterium]|nr:ATP-dependent Clp protease ATP-binding subunit [Bacilli bacterium]